MKTVIITGAGGYIGSRLTPFLIEKGYKIRAVDRFFLEIILKRIKILRLLKMTLGLLRTIFLKMLII